MLLFLTICLERDESDRLITRELWAERFKWMGVWTSQEWRNNEKKNYFETNTNEHPKSQKKSWQCILAGEKNGWIISHLRPRRWKVNRRALEEDKMRPMSLPASRCGASRCVKIAYDRLLNWPPMFKFFFFFFSYSITAEHDHRRHDRPHCVTDETTIAIKQEGVSLTFFGGVFVFLFFFLLNFSDGITDDGSAKLYLAQGSYSVWPEFQTENQEPAPMAPPSGQCSSASPYCLSLPEGSIKWNNIFRNYFTSFKCT